MVHGAWFNRISSLALVVEPLTLLPSPVTSPWLAPHPPQPSFCHTPFGTGELGGLEDDEEPSVVGQFEKAITGEGPVGGEKMN